MEIKEIESIFRRFQGTQIGELCKAYVKLLDEYNKVKGEKVKGKVNAQKT